MTIDEMQQLALQHGCDVTLNNERGIAVINKIAVEADTIELKLEALKTLNAEEFEKNYLPEPLGAQL